LEDVMTDNAGRRRVAEELTARSEALVAHAVSGLLRFPGYEAVEPESLREELARLFPVLAQAIVADQQEPTPEFVRLARPGFEARAHLGIPLATRYRTLQFLVGELSTAIIDAVRGLGEAEAIAADSLRLLLKWAGAIMAEEADVYRELDAEHVRSVEARRIAFVTDLSAGVLSGGALRDQAASFGLALDREYRPFRAIPLGDLSIEMLERELSADARSKDAQFVAGRLGTAVAGVTIARPDVPGLDAVVGLGPAAPLAAIAAAFRLATLAFDTALAFGMKGTFELGELGLRGPVLSETYIGAYLDARLLEPLDAMGEFGRIVQDTVRVFLDHGMRFEATARSLFIHANTLRHRLMVFQRTTGADLRRTEDIVKVWWALTRREIDALYH
jgi:putative transposase